MGTILKNYVQQITDEIDGTEEEKADIAEELLTHLQMLKADLIEEGKSEEAAEQLALQHFGASKTIGKEMQQAMFPYRKKALLVLGAVSLAVSFTLYAVGLLLLKDAYIGWLLGIVVTSTLLLLIPSGFLPKLERKAWLLFLLIIHLLFLCYGYLISGSMDTSASIFLHIPLLAVIITTVILLYRIVIFDYPAYTAAIRWMHLFNMTLGIGYTGITFFTLWVMLAFFQNIHPFAYAASLIPVVFWGLTYYLQIQFLKKEKQITAYILTGISSSLLLLIVWVFFR